MNLFFKIFLWFLAAISLMVGVTVFLNWTTQTEPVASRWQGSVRNQMTIFALTAAQVYDNEGEKGLRTEPHDFIADSDKVVVLTTVTLDGESDEAADVLTYDEEGKLIAFDQLGDPTIAERIFPR